MNTALQTRALSFSTLPMGHRVQLRREVVPFKHGSTISLGIRNKTQQLRLSKFPARNTGNRSMLMVFMGKKTSKRAEKRRQKRESQQEWVKTQLRDRLGLPPIAVEVSFLILSAAVFSAGIGLVAAVLVPTLITTISLAGFVAPLVLLLLGTIGLLSTIGGLLLPIPVFLALASLASLLAGVVIPAALAALGGVFILSRLSDGGEKEEEDAEKVKEGKNNKSEDVIEADFVEVTSSGLTAEEEEALSEFDRRLLGECSEWSVSEVGTWLAQNQFEDLVETFSQNEIDGATLLSLGANELRDELGVTSLPKRRALYAKIEKLQTKLKQQRR